MFRIVVLTLLLIGAAHAEDKQYFTIDGIDLNSTSTTTFTMPKTNIYTYEPQPYITAKELSEVVAVLLPAIACRHVFDDCGVVKRIEALPPEVKRHFVQHGN